MASAKKTVHLPDELEVSPRGQETSISWLANSTSANLSRLVREVSPERVTMWRESTFRGEQVTDVPTTSASMQPQLLHQHQQQQQLRQRRKQARSQPDPSSSDRQGPSNFTKLPDIQNKPHSLPTSPAGSTRPPRHHRTGSHAATATATATAAGNRASLTGLGSGGMPSFIAGATVAGPLSGMRPVGSNTAVTAAALFALSAGQTITAASIAYTAGNGTIISSNSGGYAGAVGAPGGGGGAVQVAVGGSAGSGAEAGPAGAAPGGGAGGAAVAAASGGGGGAGLIQPQVSGTTVRALSSGGDGTGGMGLEDEGGGGGGAGGGGVVGAAAAFGELLPLEAQLAEDERIRNRLVSLPNIVCRSANGDVFLVDLGNVQAMLHKRELGEEGLAILNRLTPSLAHSLGSGGSSPRGDASRRRRRGHLSRRAALARDPQGDDDGGGHGGGGGGGGPSPTRSSSSRHLNSSPLARSGSMAPGRSRAAAAAAAAALHRGHLGSISTAERDPLMEADLERHVAATEALVEERRRQLQEDWRQGRMIAANPAAAAREMEEAKRAAAIEFTVSRFVPRRLALMALNMPPEAAGGGGGGGAAAAAAGGEHGVGAADGDGSGAAGADEEGGEGKHSPHPPGGAVFGKAFKAGAQPHQQHHWKNLQAGIDRLYDKLPFMSNWVSTIKKLHREENGGWDGLIHGVDELYVKGREEHQGTNIYVLKCHELGVTPSTQVIQQLSSAEANMAHCHLGRQGAAALRHALSANVTITHLNLQDNHLDATGLDSILAGLYSGTMAKQPRARKLLEKRIQNAANTLASAVNGTSGGGGAAATATATIIHAAGGPRGGGSAAASTALSGPPSPIGSPAAAGRLGAAAFASSPPRRSAPGDLNVRLIPAHLAKEQEQRRRAEEERLREEERMRAQMEAARATQEAGGLQDTPEWLRLINDSVGGKTGAAHGGGLHVMMPGRKQGVPAQPTTTNRLTCAITSLDLSNNPLGINGVRALADLLDPTVTPYQFVKQLLLNKCGIPEGGGRALAIALSRGNTRLAVLGLSNNSLGNATASMFGEVLALPSGLEDLDLSWNQIKSEGARALSEGVAQNNTLTRLNLSWNGLENPGVEALGAMLLRNESLTSLDLTNTRMGAEACLMLAEGIRNNHTLEALILNGNSVGDDGARFLMDAIKCNSSLKYLGLQGTNMSAAARGNTQAASFNPLSPDGSYTLNLEVPTDRAVALQLAQMDAGAASDLMKNIKLNDRNISSCKAMRWPDCLPVSGVLSCDFVSRRMSKVIGVIETKKFVALAAQFGSSSMADKEKLALVEVMSPFNYVLCHQAATLLRTFSIGDEMVLAAALLFTRCADLDENVTVLTEALGAEASTYSLQRVLGWYSYLRFSNPTGHYELALSSRVHAALATRLKDVSYSEPVDCLNWHNIIHDQYTKVSKTSPNFGPPEEWKGIVPHAGTLSFDYVSGCLVPENAQPISFELLDEVLTSDLGIDLDGSGRPIPAPDFEVASQQVARLRPVVSNMAFTTAQVKKLVEAFSAPPHRVEVLVTCYCLIVDRVNMWTILYGMEPLEQALAMWRLGPANLFDKAHPSGHYVLDLTNPHHESVARKLVDLAMASTDLPNFWNLRLNGVKRSVIENRNMWGAFMAETQTPFMEFDFIGPDGWEVLGRAKAEVEVLGPGDRLELRTRQARRLELSRTRAMYAYYEDGSGWQRPPWQNRQLLMRALADKAPWQAAWDRMARMLLRSELRRGGMDGDSPLEDAFYTATAGEDAMTLEQFESLLRDWGYNRLESSYMCDLFDAEARPANAKDGPAYKPYPVKPASPGGGDGSPPPAPPAAAGPLSSPMGRSMAQRDRAGRQQSQLAAAMALAASSSAFASSTPPSYDSPSPSRGRPGGVTLADGPQRSGSHSLQQAQQLLQLQQQQQQQQMVPNLVVEFPTFVKLVLREPPRVLRTLHNANAAVVDGMELAVRPSRKNGPSRGGR